jgi:prepilin-type N-terminal cleavage/methylation domain-containing protein
MAQQLAMTKLRPGLVWRLSQGLVQRQGCQGMTMLEMLVGLMLLTIFMASMVLASQITLRYSVGPVDTNADASKAASMQLTDVQLATQIAGRSLRRLAQSLQQADASWLASRADSSSGCLTSKQGWDFALASDGQTDRWSVSASNRSLQGLHGSQAYRENGAAASVPVVISSVCLYAVPGMAPEPSAATPKPGLYLLKGSILAPMAGQANPLLKPSLVFFCYPLYLC